MDAEIACEHLEELLEEIIEEQLVSLPKSLQPQNPSYATSIISVIILELAKLPIEKLISSGGIDVISSEIPSMQKNPDGIINAIQVILFKYNKEISIYHDMYSMKNHNASATDILEQIEGRLVDLNQ